jgi:predicted CopG family antitoxin
MIEGYTTATVRNDVYDRVNKIKEDDESWSDFIEDAAKRREEDTDDDE